MSQNPMFGAVDSVLNKSQDTALHVLAYLFLRMSMYDKAGRVFKAISKLASKETPCIYAHAGLAAIALEKKEGKEANKHIRIVMDNIALSSRNAAFYLMQAKAFWLEERFDEAKSALESYVYLVAEKSK